jgi:large subunit ribosomal protein L2
MLRKHRPVTPSLRKKRTIDYSSLSDVKPFKTLLSPLKNSSGRNNKGKITVRHRGGKNKRKYRKINFNKDLNSQAKVLTVEYDPNRSAFISLVQFISGEKKYIIAPKGIKIGQQLSFSSVNDISLGNVLSLKDIPIGTPIHNIELVPGKGAQLVRSAGTSAVITAKNNSYVSIKLPSGQIRHISSFSKASVGQVSNSDHRSVVLGKAGLKRKLGKRPTVRGSVMNPCDHPHGGGEGRAPVGAASPRTPWGKPALGLKTRKSKKNHLKLTRSTK